MELGAFSISLAIEDMGASRSFHSKLGFEIVGGDGETGTIMANQSHVIGLFHAMFETNILTFNPGWFGVGESLEGFTDVRELSAQLKAKGLEVTNDTTGGSSEGSASFTLIDPGGNVILVDQHVG